MISLFAVSSNLAHCPICASSLPKTEHPEFSPDATPSGGCRCAQVRFRQAAAELNVIHHNPTCSKTLLIPTALHAHASSWLGPLSTFPDVEDTGDRRLTLDPITAGIRNGPLASPLWPASNMKRRYCVLSAHHGQSVFVTRGYTWGMCRCPCEDTAIPTTRVPATFKTHSFHCYPRVSLRLFC